MEEENKANLRSDPGSIQTCDPVKVRENSGLVREGYKKTKLGWIPEDWEVIKLGNVGEFKNGINKGKEDFGFGIPFINLMDVFGKPVLLQDHWGLVNATQSEIENYSLKKGDVLFIRSSVKPSGVGLTSVVKDDVPNTVYSGFLIRYRPNDDNTFNIDFLQYCFHEIGFRQRLIVRSSSSANTNINQDNLKQLLIGLPTLPEQKKIATILSTWDRAIAKQEQLITAKQEFKKGLMQLLLTGKKRFEGFEGEWKILEFEKIAERTKGKFDCKKEVTNKRCIELEHLNQDTGTINGWTDSKNQKSIKNVFYEGQVLFGKLRPYLRKFWFASFSGVCSSEIWVLHSVKGASSNDYLFFLVQSNRFIQIANATTGSKMPRADWSYLSKFPFKTPKIPEQQKIASVLSAADREIGLLQNELAKFRGQKRGLMQRLLTGEVRVEI